MKPDSGANMNLIQVLNGLNRPTVTLPADTSLHDAIEIMAERGTSAVVVMSGEQVKGIVSRGDVLRSLRSQPTETAAPQTPLRRIMSTELVVGHPEEPLHQAIGHMQAAGVAHLPVLQDGRLLFLLHRDDLLQRQIQLLHDQIDHLQHYIETLHNAQMD
jgi:acetoin utilization protein AcuB